MPLARREIAFYAIAVVASIGFAVLAGFVALGHLDPFDISTELAVHRLDSTPLDIVMRSATTIGSDVVIWPTVALVALLAIRARQRAVAWIIVGDAAAAVIANNVLKVIFARSRPQLFDKIGLPTSYSFPSGHAMSAMAIWGGLAACLMALYPTARRGILVAAIVLIFLIGTSRVYLGVHWPTDVMGGWLAGAPLLVATVHLLHRMRR